MKVSLFITLVFCISCSKKLEFQHLEMQLNQALEKTRSEKTGGIVYTVLSKHNELMIIEANVKNAEIAEKVIVCAFEKPVTSDIPHQLKHSSIDHHSDKRSLVIHSGSDNKVWFIGLDESQSRDKYALLNDDMLIKPNLTSMFLAYGISVLKGQWKLNVLLSAHHASAFDILEAANLAGGPSIGNGEPAAKCTSGGEGATECSVTEKIGPIEQNCS